jgi:hypothetical protein
MTGTRARAAHDQRLLAMELLLTLNHSKGGRGPLRSLLSILRQPLTVPRAVRPHCAAGAAPLPVGRPTVTRRHPENAPQAPLTVPAPSGMTHRGTILSRPSCDRRPRPSRGHWLMQGRRSQAGAVTLQSDRGCDGWRGRAPEIRYAPLQGDRIAYQVLGGGPPDLVLTPGSFGHLDIAREDPGISLFCRTLASFAG